MTIKIAFVIWGQRVLRAMCVVFCNWCLCYFVEFYSGRDVNFSRPRVPRACYWGKNTVIKEHARSHVFIYPWIQLPESLFFGMQIDVSVFEKLKKERFGFAKFWFFF